MCQRTLQTAIVLLCTVGTWVSPVLADDTYIFEAPHYHHASTAAEGFLHGWGYLERSFGIRDLLQSQALINIEVARNLAIENRLLHIAKFWEGRHLWLEEQRMRRGPYRLDADHRRLAHMDAPRALNASELDPVTGELAWPAVLRDVVFAEPQQQLDRIFAKWPITGRFDYNEQSAVKQLANYMQGLLKPRIKSLPGDDYMAGMRFLERIAFTAKTPSARPKAPQVASANR
jgi:hypothetical protein